jgi:hypothetical protein
MNNNNTSPFNSSLESGIRALNILVAIFPKCADLQKLVDFDYIIVHSGDLHGPESLHAPLPMRAGELLVRRSIVEAGLLLMMSRGLVKRITSGTGIEYIADESANAFVNSFETQYLLRLKDRANWVSYNFGDMSDEELQEITRHFFDKWTTQFHTHKNMNGGGNE